MWRDITITAANQASYEDLCHRLCQSQKMFECGHRQACSREGDRWWDITTRDPKTKKLPVNVKPLPVEPGQRLDKAATPSLCDTEERSIDTNSEAAPDIRALQRELIRALHSSGTPDVGLGQAVGHVEVCQRGVEPIGDDVVLRVCKKMEKRDSSVVAVVGKMLLLPKLYHLDTKLSTPVMDGLTQLMEEHTALVVDSTLLPLLHHLPALEEHHRDLLAHLLPICSPHIATRLLRAYAERPHHRETDLPTFHLLCETADAREPDTHVAALTVLERTAPLHRTSVKFGQCLLMVVRRFGPHLQDLEGLRSVVATHTSSLRKVVEVQMKKLEKKR